MTRTGRRSAVRPALAALLAFGACACSQPLDAQTSNPPSVSVPQGVKAFPGAVGHGSLASGGRNGRMIFVNTLADDGPGSLRNCFEAQGRRTCIFRVNGTIRFRTPAIIRNPHLTIAGQTAPGGGITLSHAGGANGRTPLVIKGTENVVVRNLRVRTDRVGGSRAAEDNITIEDSKWIIVDHVSASWGRDEIINGYGDNDNVTISNSIFAWGMPEHDKCALLASDPVDAQNFSFIGNLCAHNGDRNPDINFPDHSCVEVVNNVFYNASSRFTEVWEQFGSTAVSIVGNTYFSGPNTGNLTVGIARDRLASKGTAQIYLWDNIFSGAFQQSSGLAGAIVNQPACPLTLFPKGAGQARVDVMTRAGAFPRDSLDEQVIADIRNGTGRIGAEVRTIPTSSRAAPYPDADRDGMDDRWERSHGLDTAKFDAWADIDRNGWTNFDDFLHYLQQAVSH